MIWVDFRKNQSNTFHKCEMLHNEESIFDELYEREFFFVDLKRVMFHLSEIEQVHHQIAHHPRLKQCRLNPVDALL